MTAKELYMAARNLMKDNLSDKHLDQHYITDINVLLAELYAENNQLRLFHGKEALKEIPMVSVGADELTYEPEMLRFVLPKGLAARFFIDEDDRSKYTIYQTEFMNARSQVMPIVVEEGWDV